MTGEGRRLDPKDWASFESDFQMLMKRCLERMKGARDLPWVPKPSDMANLLALRDDEPGLEADKLFQCLAQDIMPYATGNTHPRFFGWVHGTGLPIGVAAELVAATMNSNCGGRDHGAVAVEKAVLDWVGRVAGMPDGTSGILTSGTSQATILALSAARVKRFGADVRQKGIKALPDVRVYAAQGAHSCVSKALDVMGHGSDSLRIVPTIEGRMDTQALAKIVAEDIRIGAEPLAVIATAGSVNLGTFDPIQDIATFCKKEKIWFHIDGAFGFWTRLADQPWRSLSDGVEDADSIACDLHKWMFVPYDCGACLIRDADLHRATFAERPPYLAPQEAGLGGGDLWYCDYGLELSRGFKALKVWAAIRGYGIKAMGDVITDNCKQAALMGDLAEKTDGLYLAHPVTSNVCCIGLETGHAAEIAAQLQLSGDVVFSTTMIEGRECLRAAIVNHRTTAEDIIFAVEQVAKAVSQ